MLSGEAVEPAHENVVDARPASRPALKLAQVLGANVEVAREHARKAARDLGDERLRAHDLGRRELRVTDVAGGVKVPDDEPVERDGMAVARLRAPLVDPERVVLERLETGREQDRVRLARERERKKPLLSRVITPPSRAPSGPLRVMT